MTITSRATLTNGKEALHSLRSHAERLADKGIATTSAAAERATHAAERASHKAAQALSHGSKEISKAAQRYYPLRPTGLSTVPVVGGAFRLARRHPALVFAAGTAVAALGYVAWRMQADEEAQNESSELTD
jgi:hypothetical protein